MGNFCTLLPRSILKVHLGGETHTHRENGGQKCQKVCEKCGKIAPFLSENLNSKKIDEDLLRDQN